MTILFDIDGMRAITATCDLEAHGLALRRFVADVERGGSIPSSPPSDLQGPARDCYMQLASIARIEEGAHVD